MTPTVGLTAASLAMDPAICRVSDRIGETHGVSAQPQPDLRGFLLREQLVEFGAKRNEQESGSWRWRERRELQLVLPRRAQRSVVLFGVFRVVHAPVGVRVCGPVCSPGKTHKGLTAFLTVTNCCLTLCAGTLIAQIVDCLLTLITM